MASTARRSSSRRYPSQGQAVKPAGSPCFGSHGLDGGAAAGTGETWSAPAVSRVQQQPTSSESSQNERISSVRNRLRQMLQESSGSESETWCNTARTSGSAASGKARPSTKPSAPQAVPADVHEETPTRGSALEPSAISGLGARRLLGRDVPAYVGARVAVLDARLARFVEPTGTIIETRCNGQRVRVQHDGTSDDFRYYNTGKDGEYQLILADDSPAPPAGCLHFARQAEASPAPSATRHASETRRSLPDPPTPSSSSVQEVQGKWVHEEPPQQSAQSQAGQRRARYSEMRRVSRIEKDEALVTPRAEASDDARRSYPAELPAAPATPVVKSKRYSELRRSASMPQDAGLRERPNPMLGGASAQNTPQSPAVSPSPAATPRRYSALRREKANIQAQEAPPTPQHARTSRSTSDPFEQEAPLPPKEPKARQERTSSFPAPEEATERREGARRIHELEETCEGLAAQLKACEQTLSREVTALREQMQREVQASEHRLLSKVQEEVNQTLHSTLTKLMASKAPGRQDSQAKQPHKHVACDSRSSEEEAPVPSKPVRNPPVQPPAELNAPRQLEAPLEKARLDAEMARIADLRRFASGVLGLVGSESGLNPMQQPPQGDLYPSPFPRQPDFLATPPPAAWTGPPGNCPPSMVDRSWPHPSTMDMAAAGLTGRPPEKGRACSRSRSTSESMCTMPTDLDGRPSMPQVPMQTMTAQCHGQTHGSKSLCGGSCLQQSRPPPVPWGDGHPGWEDHADRDGRIVF